MKTLIIDGDNHLYRAAFKFHNFTNIDGKPSGVIYGVLSMITGMIRQFKPDNVVVVFDGKKSELRKLWLPGYKDRKDKNLKINYKEVLAQKEFLVTFLPLLGIEVIRSPHDEADDMIYLVTKKYRGTQKIIASRDKDFNQLITPKTWVYDGVEQVMLKPSNLKRRRGYTPK